MDESFFFWLVISIFNYSKLFTHWRFLLFTCPQLSIFKETDKRRESAYSNALCGCWPKQIAFLNLKWGVTSRHPPSQTHNQKCSTLWIIWNIFTSFCLSLTLFFFRVFFFFWFLFFWIESRGTILLLCTTHHLPSQSKMRHTHWQSASFTCVCVDNEKTGNNLDGHFLYQSIFLSLKGWQKTNVFFFFFPVSPTHTFSFSSYVSII